MSKEGVVRPGILVVAAMGVVGLLGCHCGMRAPTAAAEVDRPPPSTAGPLPAPAPGTGFAVSGPALGTRQVTPRRCIAGGHYQFLGADLVDEQHGLVVRAVADPVYGTAIRVFDRKDSDVATMVLHRADCKKLVADLDSTGSMVNDVLYVSLKLDLDCRTADGNAVVGSYSADECQ
jgi:hypothetical protein